jgi:hypothetical protein
MIWRSPYPQCLVFLMRLQLPSPPSVGFRFAVPPPSLLDWSSPGGPAVTAACDDAFQQAVKRLKAVGGVQVRAVAATDLCTVTGPNGRLMAWCGLVGACA